MYPVPRLADTDAVKKNSYGVKKILHGIYFLRGGGWEKGDAT